MRRHFSISGRLGAALALFAGVLAIAGPADAAEKPYGLEVGVASQYVGKGLDKIRVLMIEGFVPPRE